MAVGVAKRNIKMIIGILIGAVILVLLFVVADIIFGGEWIW